MKGTREEVSATAWAEFVNWLRVSPEEARRALHWLHEMKVIDYRERHSGSEIEALIDDDLNLPQKLPANPKSEGIRRKKLSRGKKT